MDVDGGRQFWTEQHAESRLGGCWLWLPILNPGNQRLAICDPRISCGAVIRGARSVLGGMSPGEVNGRWDQRAYKYVPIIYEG